MSLPSLISSDTELQGTGCRIRVEPYCHAFTRQTALENTGSTTELKASLSFPDAVLFHLRTAIKGL